MAERYYTVEEANALVPWLDSIFQQLQPLRQDILQRRETGTQQVHHSRRNGSSSTEKQMAETQDRTEALRRRIGALLDEVLSKGIVVRDVDRGLVDFPALREGREVHLCWLWGEPAVEFWHEVDAGFAGRQPL